jgi:hypothetical protein
LLLEDVGLPLPLEVAVDDGSPPSPPLPPWPPLLLESAHAAAKLMDAASAVTPTSAR